MSGRHHRRHRHGPGCPPHHRRGRGLRGKLFVMLGLAIVLTALSVGLVMWLVGGPATWKKEAGRARTFLAGRFEAVWDQPAERLALTRAVAADLDVGVRVTDGGGQTLDLAGQMDGCEELRKVEVAGRGRVEICFDGHRPEPRWWNLALLILVPASVLWVVSGLWARKIARPLLELTEVARDLGEGKLERRAALRHGARGEVGELTHAINEMADRLEKKLKAERELLATVSHELRTPLSRVRLLCELGQDGGRSVVGEIEREAVEMDTLVGDLLAAARLDFQALSPRPLDARKIAVDAAAACAERGGGEAVELDVSAAPAALVTGDATLITRALAIVLDNARRHGGGAKVLRVVERGGKVAFEVDDRGAGFKPEEIGKVFEPFYRGSQRASTSGAEGESSGVGLGLAIVERIAKAHGGRAWAENLDGGGARVGFEW